MQSQVRKFIFAVSVAGMLSMTLPAMAKPRDGGTDPGFFSRVNSVIAHILAGAIEDRAGGRDADGVRAVRSFLHAPADEAQFPLGGTVPARSGILHFLMSDAAAKSWAVLFARIVLGLIFFMAGVLKVFSLGPAGHVQRFFLPFQHTFLPVWSLWAVGFTIPFIELLAGALVILGFKTRYALVALGVVLAIVTFG